MKALKIADGAYFVPPYFRRNVQANIPGLINQSTAIGELKYEEEILEYDDELKKEESECVPGKTANPIKQVSTENK